MRLIRYGVVDLIAGWHAIVSIWIFCDSMRYDIIVRTRVARQLCYLCYCLDNSKQDQMGQSIVLHDAQDKTRGSGLCNEIIIFDEASIQKNEK